MIQGLTIANFKKKFFHPGFQKYFKNTGWMFFGQIFSLIISFFVGVWVARYLGPENFGILSYTLAFVGIFAIFSDLGVSSILNRDLVRFPEKRDELLGTGFRLKLISSISTYIVAGVFALLIQTSFLNKLLIIVFSSSFIFQSINVINTFFYAQVKSKNNVRVVITATLLSTILKIIIILSGKGVIWLISAYVADSIFQGIGFLLTYKKSRLKLSAWKYNKFLAKEMLEESWPLMLAAVAGFILLKIDQVMITWMMGNRATGLYAVAVKFVEIWYFVPAIISGSLFPAIINAKKISLLIYKKRLRAFFILMASIAILIAIPTTIFANLMISSLFGREYLEVVGIFQIYVWSGIGLFVSWAINQYLLSENKSMTILYINSLSMAVNIALNIVLIPKIGLLGAALATLISYSIIPMIFLILKFHKRLSGSVIKGV